MDHGLDVAPGLIDLTVDIAFPVQPRRVGSDGLAVESDLDDVVTGDQRGRHGARHKKVVGILGGARADVTETVQDPFVRQNVTCSHDIRNAGFIVVGRIALRRTLRMT